MLPLRQPRSRGLLGGGLPLGSVNSAPLTTHVLPSAAPVCGPPSAGPVCGPPSAAPLCGPPSAGPVCGPPSAAPLCGPPSAGPECGPRVRAPECGPRVRAPECGPRVRAPCAGPPSAAPRVRAPVCGPPSAAPRVRPPCAGPVCGPPSAAPRVLPPVCGPRVRAPRVRAPRVLPPVCGPRVRAPRVLPPVCGPRVRPPRVRAPRVRAPVCGSRVWDPVCCPPVCGPPCAAPRVLPPECCPPCAAPRVLPPVCGPRVRPPCAGPLSAAPRVRAPSRAGVTAALPTLSGKPQQQRLARPAGRLTACSSPAPFTSRLFCGQSSALALRPEGPPEPERCISGDPGPSRAWLVPTAEPCPWRRRWSQDGRGGGAHAQAHGSRRGLLHSQGASRYGANVPEGSRGHCREWFRSAVVKEDALPADLMTRVFSTVDPIYELHRSFLREVEQRLVLWEGSSGARAPDCHRRVGDILLKNMRQLKQFTGLFQRHDEVLTELEKAARRFPRLEAVYRAFELQKVCYLPFSTFLLKPVQRLVQYRLLLGRLCGCHTPGHRDYADCRAALAAITEVTSALQHSLARLENLQKLTELQRDLVGIESLVAPGREFIREGCLHKLTRKGLQPRLFFLFSDVLLYTSRGVAGACRFRIRGLLPLRGMLLLVLDPPVEESDREWSVPHCFTICAAQKTIVVAARFTALNEDRPARMHSAGEGEVDAGPECHHRSSQGRRRRDPTAAQRRAVRSSPRVRRRGLSGAGVGRRCARPPGRLGGTGPAPGQHHGARVLVPQHQRLQSRPQRRRQEPAFGVFAQKVQEQQRLAEALGGLHQLLPLLLQNAPGRLPAGQPPAAGLHRERAQRGRRRPQGARLQAAVPIARLLLPGRQHVRVSEVDGGDPGGQQLAREGGAPRGGGVTPPCPATGQQCARAIGTPTPSPTRGP